MDTLIHKIPLISVALLGCLALGTAQAQQKSLVQLAKEQQYAEATHYARTLTPQQAIAQSFPGAQSNNAPLQWILAESYWRAGNSVQAIEWGYRALVGTQMDASSCLYNAKVAPWMMQSYENIFREANRNPHLKSEAIKKALSYHLQHPEPPVDPNWACRVGAWLAGKAQDAKTSNKNTQPRGNPKLIEQRRKSTLQDLTKKAGLKPEMLQG